MKQAHTINREIIHIFSKMDSSQAADEHAMFQQTPRKHVVNNIMNYARAMCVMQNAKGDSYVLLNN